MSVNPALLDWLKWFPNFLAHVIFVSKPNLRFLVPLLHTENIMVVVYGVCRLLKVNLRYGLKNWRCVVCHQGIMRICNVPCLAKTSSENSVLVSMFVR